MKPEAQNLTDMRARPDCRQPLALSSGTALPLALALLALAIAAPARADRYDLYFATIAAPGLAVMHDSLGTGASSLAVMPSVGVAGWYGLTHSLHVGVAGRFAGAPSAGFNGATVVTADGTHQRGLLQADVALPSAALLVRYRFDNGRLLEPYLAAEGGLGWSRSIHQTLDTQTSERVGFALPGYTRGMWTARAEGGVEWRLSDHWMLGAGLALTTGSGGVRGLQVELPLTVAWIQ